MHLALPGWDRLESARDIKAFFELGGILLFAGVVLFEVLAHRRQGSTKAKGVFTKLGLISFGLAVIFEFGAYSYSKRVDTLADERIASALESAKKRPFEDRLIDCLDLIDKRIIPALRNGQTNFAFNLPEHQYINLRNLNDEPEAKAYMSIQTTSGIIAIAGKGQFMRGTLTLRADLLKQAAKKPNPN